MMRGRDRKATSASETVECLYTASVRLLCRGKQPRTVSARAFKYATQRSRGPPPKSIRSVRYCRILRQCEMYHHITNHQLVILEDESSFLPSKVSEVSGTAGFCDDARCKTTSPITISNPPYAMDPPLPFTPPLTPTPLSTFSYLYFK